MTDPSVIRHPFIPRLARRAEQALYDVRRRMGVFKTVTGSTRARLGIYVAYFDAAWVFEDHLRCMRDLSAGPVNYYVMANCTSSTERMSFDATICQFGYPIPFYPRPAYIQLTHGESLQRMIESTSDEIIVLCDVDAFPIRYGWDDYVLQELSTKDVVACVVDMPERTMPVFLHPSFIAFKRSLLIENRLDVLPGEGSDPAYKITKYLKSRGRLTPEHVTGLFPTRRAITIYPPGKNELFGHSDLIHGFGTTYADLMFHFWFSRCIARRESPLDKFGNALCSISAMDMAIAETLRFVRDRCVRGRQQPQ